MSTDPTKKIPPLPSQDLPQEPPNDPAAPTVQAPAQSGGRWAQEPPTQPVPQRSAPPPPPPPGSAAPRRDRQDPVASPTRMDRPQPTRMEQAPPTQRDRPQGPAGRAPAPPPQWNQPQGNQPPQQQTQWQEPQDDRAPQWSPQQAPAGGQRQPPASPPRRKRRVRRSVMAVFAVLVLLVLLVIGDRVALAVTENAMASQFQSNGLPVKPSVTIEGFPFLTQLAAKDFNKVDISASNIPVSLPTGGNLTITSIKATINGLHISSYSSTASARVDRMTATGFVSFGSLLSAGGLDNNTGLTVTPAGNNTVKITAGIGGVLSDTEEAQILTTGPQTITVKVLPGGTLGSLIGSFGTFSFNLPPGVPPTLKITSLVLNSQGLTISASATNATFSPSPSPSPSSSK